MVRIAARRVVAVIALEVSAQGGEFWSIKEKRSLEEAFVRAFRHDRIPHIHVYHCIITGLGILARAVREYVTPEVREKIRVSVDAESIINEYLNSFWRIGDEDTPTDPEN
jgi:hypothetical protein